MLGAGQVIGVDSVAARLDLSEHFGADDVVDFNSVDPVEEIMRLTNGKSGAESGRHDCQNNGRSGGMSGL